MHAAVVVENDSGLRRQSAEAGAVRRRAPCSSIPRGARWLVVLAMFAAACSFAAEAPERRNESAPAAAQASAENGTAAAEQETNPGSAPDSDVPSTLPKQSEAERQATETREKRERERIELIESAEQFVETADRRIIDSMPYPLNLLFSMTLFHIPLWRYLAAAVLMATACLSFWFAGKRFNRLADRMRRDGARFGKVWHTLLDVAVLAFRNPVRLLITGLLVRLVSGLLVTSRHPDFVWISGLLIFLACVWYLYDLVGLVDQACGDMLFRSPDRLLDTVRPIVLMGARFLVLLVAGMQIYQKITGQTMVSVIAGLGIGGLALALASQETLKNLFGFASIAFDQAFLVGDDVAFGSYEGTVEHVGLRSMRIRAYDGVAVILPNASVVNAGIVNKNRRPFLRREIRIHLSPLNPYAKVRRAMDEIGETVNGHEGRMPGRPPAVRFIDYEPGRFVIQALFWYDARRPDYADEASRINLEICRRLSEAGVLYAER